MAIAWGSTLPTDILQDGYGQQAIANSIRTKMEAGLDKLRRRYTTTIVNSTPAMILTYSQYEDMETYFNTTLQGGTLSFDFTDPITETSYEYRFLTPPAYTPFGGVKFIVNMQWERIG